MTLQRSTRMEEMAQLQNLAPRSWSEAHQEDHDYDFDCGDRSCYCALPVSMLRSYVFTRQANRSLRERPGWQALEEPDFPADLVFNGPLDVRLEEPRLTTDASNIPRRRKGFIVLTTLEGRNLNRGLPGL